MTLGTPVYFRITSRRQQLHFPIHRSPCLNNMCEREINWLYWWRGVKYKSGWSLWYIYNLLSITDCRNERERETYPSLMPRWTNSEGYVSLRQATIPRPQRATPWSLSACPLANAHGIYQSWRDWHGECSRNQNRYWMRINIQVGVDAWVRYSGRKRSLAGVTVKTVNLKRNGRSCSRIAESAFIIRGVHWGANGWSELRGKSRVWVTWVGISSGAWQEALVLFFKIQMLPINMIPRPRITEERYPKVSWRTYYLLGFGPHFTIPLACLLFSSAVRERAGT